MTEVICFGRDFFSLRHILDLSLVLTESRIVMTSFLIKTVIERRQKTVKVNMLKVCSGFHKIEFNNASPIKYILFVIKIGIKFKN